MLIDPWLCHIVLLPSSQAPVGNNIKQHLLSDDYAFCEAKDRNNSAIRVFGPSSCPELITNSDVGHLDVLLLDKSASVHLREGPVICCQKLKGHVLSAFSLVSKGG